MYQKPLFHLNSYINSYLTFYRLVDAVCTASFDIHKLYVLPTQRMYVSFVWISEQTATISLYSIN